MATEFDYLIGGRITEVTQKPDEDGWNPDGLMTALTVTFAKPKKITMMGETFVAKAVNMEVWQDEEGNGAGALVLASALEIINQGGQ